MTTATPQETVSLDESPFPPLNALDRSDACASGAVQGLVRVAKDAQDLVFDNHTYNKHEAALLVDGWTVVEDVREAVLNPPRTDYDTSDH